jgi:anti-anti-sigma factor
MAVKLRLVAEDDRGAAVVAAEGDLVFAGSTGEIVNPFEGLLGAGWGGRKVLLDFSKAAFLDSAGIGWLIGSTKLFRQNGGMLVVHSIPPRVRQMLDMLKVGQIVPLAASEAAARETLAAGHPAKAPKTAGRAGGGSQ